MLGIFSVLAFMVILMAVVPNLLWVSIKANETLAMQSMQQIITAEQRYVSAHPGIGFSCPFDLLGWPTEEEKKNPLRTSISPGNPSRAFRAGYVFTLSGCTQGSVLQAFRPTSECW